MARKKPVQSSFHRATKFFLHSRGFFWFVAVSFVMAVGLIFSIAASRPWGARMFPVRKVTVTGAHYLDHVHLEQLLSPMVKGGFFAVHPEYVRNNIRAMPWVADAMVQRVWPDRVMVTIQERKPVARWNNNSLLSAAGIVFIPDRQSFPDGLPDFMGPPGSQVRMLQCFGELQRTLHALGTGVASLELTSWLSWNLVLQNGMQMRLGHSDVLTHLDHFVKVYPGVVGDRVANVDYVDLRYPDGFAVRWKKHS